MGYYAIRTSGNKKIIGHYPQVKEIRQNCDVWNEPRFVEHIHFQKVDFIPITANAVLYSSAEATDLIAVTGMGFSRKLLISGTLKSLIQSHRKTGLQFFRSGIFHKEVFLEDYWIVNSFEINMELINFKNSEVSLMEYFSELENLNFWSIIKKLNTLKT